MRARRPFRSCCRDCLSSLAPASAACFRCKASSLAFAASAVWVSTSRRAAARSCSSRADRSRSCCRDFCSSARRSPQPVSAGTLPQLLSPPARSGFRHRVAPPQDPAPATRPIVLLLETLQQLDIAPCNGEFKDSVSAQWCSRSGDCPVSLVVACTTCTDLSLLPLLGGKASNRHTCHSIGIEIAGSRRVLRIRQVSRLIRGSLGFRRPCHREHSRGYPQGRGSSLRGQGLIVFCANGASSESFRDASAISQAVFICSLRMTARPICNHLSHGDTACCDASLCAPLMRNPITRMEDPPLPLSGLGYQALYRSTET